MQITMTDIEFNELQQRVRTAEAAAVAATAERDRMAQEGMASSVSKENMRLFAIAFAAASHVVRFAVANYPPEAVRGWPIPALTELADALEGIVGVDYDYKALALELRTFAREAKAIEDKRKDRPQTIPSAYGADNTKIVPKDDEDLSDLGAGMGA